MDFTDWCKAHPRFMGVTIAFVVFVMVLWIVTVDVSPPAGMFIAFAGTVGSITAIAFIAWFCASDGRRAQL